MGIKAVFFGEKPNFFGPPLRKNPDLRGGDPLFFFMKCFYHGPKGLRVFKI